MTVNKYEPADIIILDPDSGLSLKLNNYAELQRHLPYDTVCAWEVIRGVGYTPYQIFLAKSKHSDTYTLIARKILTGYADFTEILSSFAKIPGDLILGNIVHNWLHDEFAGKRIGHKRVEPLCPVYI